MLPTKDKFITRNNSKLKTIGILGGIGPQATMDLEARIHRIAQDSIAPLYNSGYPPMVVYYHRYAPVLVNSDLTPVFPLQADPRLLDAARSLGHLADFLLISSNGVHMMQKEIEQASGLKVLSMIDLTLKEVEKRQWERVGVLGYKNAFVYTERLNKMGISVEIIDENLQRKLDSSIVRVMEGLESEADFTLVDEIIGGLRAKHVDGIIPGCTELPFLLKKTIYDADFINPAQLLAQEAVKYSLT